MELWEKIIIEWINCLEILKKPVENTTELQDGIFYINFLTLIECNKYKNCNQENIIIKFIEDEYPSFKVNKDGTEHIYIASLLLVHFCQILSTVHHSLQDNVCENLKHETQIRVKVFLENILPLGRDITKETMKEVIIHVEDMPITTNSFKTPPIKDFLNSPMAYSIRSKQIMTERIRELRDLKCNLAVERYANVDLRDDIQRQQNKIKYLQKMLDEKSAEIKVLREEWMKPGTPRPSRTKEDNSQEDYYKKYISDMESQLSKQQDEINKLEIEKDTQSKNLSYMQRTLLDYKEKLANSEQSLQSLSIKTELRDRELIQLRIHNEELRTHIKELNKNSNIEQSFEVEDLSLSTRMSLNTSEVLSTVIEIQLQEAKEESAILHAQVDSLKGKLNILTNDYKTAMESNKNLKEKVKTLNSMQAELDSVQKKLDVSNTDIVNLQTEKISLVTQNEDLKSLLSSREKELSEVELVNTALSTELNNLKDDTKNLKELLENEKTNALKLNSTLEQTKLLVIEHLAYIQELTDERNLYKCSVEDCSKNLRNILHCDNQFIEVDVDNLENPTLHDLTKYIETMLRNCNTTCVSYKYDIEKLKATIDETSINLSEQQLTITYLKEQNKQNLMELANIEEDKKQKDLLLNEQKEIIHKYSQEIEVLKEIRNEKLVLEQNVHELTNNLRNRELLLKSLMTQLEDLQNVKEDLKLIKEETQRNFTEYQGDINLIFGKLQQKCQTLCYEFYKIQQEKEKLEYNFNCSKEELSNTQTINARLQEYLLENKETISILEEKGRILCNELNESKQNVQELKETNRALEEQYTTMKTEANDNLESLETENAKISFELKDTIDKHNLLQQEMNDTMTQMELKTVEINELLLEISSLEAEKEHLIHSHKEMLQVKDEEIDTKEQALLTSQNKMEKLTNEASATEKKMKEIIINLQEVRAGQDAVLVTQEAALKEKCLHIEELQEHFDNSKKILNKELEDTRSSLHEYQIKFFDLENQINNQNRNIAELQEMLQLITAELETTKERCKDMDTNETEIMKVCEELEHLTKNLNSTIIESCSNFDFLDQNLHDTPKYEFTYTDNKTANILNIIKMTLDELHKSQKVILHLSCVNVDLNKILAEQKILIENSIKDKEESCSLKAKIRELEIIAEKRNGYLKNLIKNKESLKDSLEKVFASQNEIDIVLASSKQKWNEALTKFHDILHVESSVCDEFKQLQAKKASIEDTLSKYQIGYLENIKTISDILWEKFLWTEQKLHDTYLCSIHEKECLDVLTNVEEDQFPDERTMIDVKLEKYKALQIDVIKSEKEIESFTAIATIYDNNLKSGEIQSQAEIEKKLQNQINQLTKERKDLKSKMDTMRLRNVKLEKNIDDLRTEMKKLKSMETDSKEVQSLKDELERLKEQNQQLHEEKDESSKLAKQEIESRLKEFHVTYERKLEDMKQKMKTAYSEQVTKLNKDQEKILRDKLQTQTEVMCQKQREELSRYKAHVGELSSQLWSVGEKLLIEQQQKQEATQRLKKLETKIKEIEADQPIATISRKTYKVEKQEVLPENAQQGAQRMTTLITEETFERRQSIRSMQAMGNVFKTEDEEEVFDNVYLADMKKGNCIPTADVDRLSVLQMRNNLCKPHLKSSYPAEMQFLSSTLTEEEIKAGSPIEENFNDSLSQSLLPEQKPKKKDRSQTSYKKPGPPTPSKNGGRLSLQSNEIRSPRVLRERNTERKITTTPHSLKTIFSLKRQDENASGTPKTRRLSSLFRKPRQPERSDR